MTENKKECKGFFLYQNQVASILNLPPEQGMAVIRACNEYCMGNEPDLSDPIVACVFGIMRPSLEKSIRNAENGRKGGEAKASNAKQKLATIENDEATPGKDVAISSETLATFSEDLANAGERWRTLANKNKNKNKKENTPPTPQTGGDGSDSTSKKSRSRCSDDYDADFLAFWDKYPRKVSKGAAWKAYAAKRKNGRLPPDLLERLANKCLCDQWRKDDGQYIPHPATWLNREGWEDEDCTPPAEESYAAGWEEELDKLYEIGKRCEVGIFDSDEERARKNEIYKQEYEPMWADMRRRGCRAI